MTSARGGWVIAVTISLVATLGCGPTTPELEPGDCLPLPGKLRRALHADPAGGALYWFEARTGYGFDSDLYWYYQLVRYDLRNRRLDIVADHVTTPLHFLQDKVLVSRETSETNSLAMIGRDGRMQALLPDHFDVRDFEILDDHTLAVLAGGHGPRAVYLLDLNRPRPRHLIDAGLLLSTLGGKVFVRVDDAGIAIDAKTGERQSFAVDEVSWPLSGSAFWVEGSKVHSRSMTTGATQVAVATKQSWKLTHHGESILARSAVEKGRSAAMLLTGGAVTPLPTVRGGASILGATQLDGKFWALIGHNTANYSGDLASTNAETDVCLLPARSEVTFTTRSVPARFVGMSPILDPVIRAAVPNGAVQIMDVQDDPITVFIALKEKGGADLATMRARARMLHDQITVLLGDPEAKTEVLFADRRTAIYRWRRDRLGGRATAGIGEALLADPAEMDVEVRDLKNVRDKDHITCSGTVVNTQRRRVDRLELRCVWKDRKHVIQVPALEPGASHPFSASFEVNADAWPYFEAFIDGEPLQVRNIEIETRTQKVINIAAEMYASTGLALEGHETRKEFEVTLRAPSDFATRTADARTSAAAGAHERLEQLRALYGVEAATPLSLRIQVEVSDIAYTFDGKELTLDD